MTTVFLIASQSKSVEGVSLDNKDATISLNYKFFFVYNCTLLAAAAGIYQMIGTASYFPTRSLLAASTTSDT